MAILLNNRFSITVLGDGSLSTVDINFDKVLFNDEFQPEGKLVSINDCSINGGRTITSFSLAHNCIGTFNFDAALTNGQQYSIQGTLNYETE